jgi:hypothetical protein
MAAPRKAKSKKRPRRSPKTSAKQPHLVGIRLTPAMKDGLDEVALEWQMTRSAVMRELIAHALKAPPKRKR